MNARPNVDLQLTDTGVLGTMTCSTLRLRAHEAADDPEETILAILREGAALLPGPKFGGEARAADPRPPGDAAPAAAGLRAGPRTGRPPTAGHRRPDEPAKRTGERLVRPRQHLADAGRADQRAARARGHEAGARDIQLAHDRGLNDVSAAPENADGARFEGC